LPAESHLVLLLLLLLAHLGLLDVLSASSGLEF
jgi:hypothetical protein